MSPISDLAPTEEFGKNQLLLEVRFRQADLVRPCGSAGRTVKSGLRAAAHLDALWNQASQRAFCLRRLVLAPIRKALLQELNNKIAKRMIVEIEKGLTAGLREHGLVGRRSIAPKTATVAFFDQRDYSSPCFPCHDKFQ